jgi:putative peptidoglycan lipid II flippase
METPIAEKPTTNFTLPMGRVISFATIVAAGSLLGQASGLVREVVVSAQFGLSAEIDAYILANQVPTIINNIVAGSAIAAAVMPTFALYLSTGDRKEFWYVASIITNLVLLIVGGLTVLGVLLAAPIISVFGIGLPPASKALAATMLVIMMPTLALGALLNMLMAALNSLDRFVGRALIFIALNGGIIVTVVLLAPTLGIYSVAIGFTFGVLLQVLVQYFELKIENAHYSFKLDLRHPALRKVGSVFLPITILAVVGQINLAVDPAMASQLPTGSIGALRYATTVLGAFYSLGISLGIAVFPTLSRLAATNDLESTARAITMSLRLLIFVLAPLTLSLIAFANPVIGALLGRGLFDAKAVEMTGVALTMYAIGLIAYAILNVLQPAFYALSDGRTPLVIGAFMVPAHVTLNVLLIPTMAHAGIALSASLTTIFGVVVLIVLLSRRVPGIELARLAAFLMRCAILASVSTALVVWLFSALHLGVETLVGRIAGVAMIGLGGLVYFSLAMLTHTHESEMLLQTARGLIRLDGRVFHRTQDGRK